MDEAGDTPPNDVLSKFQAQVSGTPVEPSENVTVPPAVIEVELAVIPQLGPTGVQG